jgi:hypothetical protein
MVARATRGSWDAEALPPPGTAALTLRKEVDWGHRRNPQRHAGSARRPEPRCRAVTTRGATKRRLGLEIRVLLSFLFASLRLERGDHPLAGILALPAADPTTAGTSPNRQNTAA